MHQAISDRSGVTDAVRVQILAAEHWDVLATRSMTYNQIFSRISMFLWGSHYQIMGYTHRLSDFPE